MTENIELESLIQEIKDTEQKLADLRKEYREQRTAGLRAAIEARKEADAMLREEMNALGYRYNTFSWRNIA
jgi:anti-sigma-K factor RskA